MKCERCGQAKVRQESLVLVKERGPDAVTILTLEGPRGILTANVCQDCADRMRKNKWK